MDDSLLNLNSFWNAVRSYQWWVVAIELLLIGLVVYWVLRFLRGTRGARMLRGVAFVLISLALGAPASPLFVSANWLWFTAFVGANLFQSGFTRFCLLEIVLERMGVRPA